MSRKKVIVKRLNAIQNFGAMDVLCTDKTGTLTQDRIILKRHLDIFGEDFERVLEFAYLNSHFQSGLQQPSRRRGAAACGTSGEGCAPEHVFTKIDEIPFDFERRRLSVVVEQRRRRAPADLQGRRRRNLYDLDLVRDPKTPAARSILLISNRRKSETARAQRRRLPRRRRRL